MNDSKTVRTLTVESEEGWMITAVLFGRALLAQQKGQDGFQKFYDLAEKLQKQLESQRP